MAGILLKLVPMDLSVFVATVSGCMFFLHAFSNGPFFCWGNLWFFNCDSSDRFKANYCLYIGCSHEFSSYRIFSFNVVGIGCYSSKLKPVFVSSSLFFIGVIYDRHHTRMVKYYSGLVHTMPLFTITFLIFTMANIGVQERLVLSENF